MCHKHNLTDLGATNSITNLPEWTYTRGNHANPTLRSRLDYVLATPHCTNLIEKNRARVEILPLEPGRDHAEVLVHLSAPAKQPKHPPRTTYSRILTKDDKDILTKALELCAKSQDSDLAKTLHTTLNSHLEKHLKRQSNNRHLYYNDKHRKANLAYRALRHAIQDEAQTLPIKRPQNYFLLTHTAQAPNPRTHNRQHFLHGKICTAAKFGFAPNFPLGSITRDEWVAAVTAASHHARNVASKENKKGLKADINQKITALQANLAWQNPRKAWKSIRRTLQESSTFLEALEIDGQTTSDHTRVAEEVQNYFTALFASRGNDTEEEYKEWLQALDIQQIPEAQKASICPKSFSEAEISKTITELANNKASAPDHIPAEIYKQLLQDTPLVPIIARIINYAWEHHQIPDEWRISEMFLLHKSGIKTTLLNYRGITLTQVIYKIYATLVCNLLIKATESNNLLSDYQSGFRPERGVIQKLMAIKALIAQAKDNDSELHLLDIDFTRHLIKLSTGSSNSLSSTTTFPNTLLALSWTHTKIDQHKSSYRRALQIRSQSAVELDKATHSRLPSLHYASTHSWSP